MIIIEFLTSQLWLGHIHLFWDVVINRVVIIIIIKQLSLMIPSGHNCVVQTKKVKVILCIINYRTMMLCGSKGKL